MSRCMPDVTVYHTEYRVVQKTSLRELEDKVNRLLGMGWKLYGSLVVYSAHPQTVSDKGRRYCQTMTISVSD